MPYFPEEQGQGRIDAAKKKPTDLLARSGLPVPELRGQEEEQIGTFNADVRRLVARISRLFSILAPTTQDVEAADTLTLAAHAPQHEDGGSDEINVNGLGGVLSENQPAQPHDLVGAKHLASGLTTGHVLRANGATTFAFEAIQDSDVPSTIARDAEVHGKAMIRVSLGF